MPLLLGGAHVWNKLILEVGQADAHPRCGKFGVAGANNGVSTTAQECHPERPEIVAIFQLQGLEEISLLEHKVHAPLSLLSTTI